MQNQDCKMDEWFALKTLTELLLFDEKKKKLVYGIAMAEKDSSIGLQDGFMLKC